MESDSEVGVGMFNRRKRLLNLNPYPQFFTCTPFQTLFKRLFRTFESPREFPQTSKEPSVRPLNDQYPSLTIRHNAGSHVFVGDRLFLSGDGQCLLVALLKGQARTLERANRT